MYYNRIGKNVHIGTVWLFEVKYKYFETVLKILKIHFDSFLIHRYTLYIDIYLDDNHFDSKHDQFRQFFL